MSDPSVQWYDHPANASQLDLLADIIRFAADRLDKVRYGANDGPREIVWPTWAAPRDIPPAEQFATVIDFARAMAGVVVDAEFFGARELAREARDTKCYRVHWRDHTTGREHVANNGELMTFAAAKSAAALFTDGWVVGPIDQQTADRMHDALSRDLGVSG